MGNVHKLPFQLLKLRFRSVAS